MSSRLRLALNYALIFGGNGVSLPFIGLWFRAQGLSGAQIGAILATPMLARVVTGPAIAVWADGFGHRRSALAIVLATAAVGYAALPLAKGIGAWLPLWFLAATAAAAAIPLSDTLTLRLARRDGYAFAGPRGAGSLAFVIGNTVVGAALAGVGPNLIVVWIAAAAGLGALAARLALPAEPVGSALGRASERFAGVGRLVADRRFVLTILAVGLIQASHAFYYGFSAIAWKAQGLGPAVTGRLWAFSVVCEIALLWVFEPWRRRRGWSPWPLLAVGGLAAAIRWAGLALDPPLIALWPLQALHALSFAATFVAGLELVERLCPPHSATAGQMLSSALSSGVLIGLATLVSGALYDGYGPGGYWAMAAMAAAGTGLAFTVRPPA